MARSRSPPVPDCFLIGWTLRGGHYGGCKVSGKNCRRLSFNLNFLWHDGFGSSNKKHQDTTRNRKWNSNKWGGDASHGFRFHLYLPCHLHFPALSEKNKMFQASKRQVLNLQNRTSSSTSLLLSGNIWGSLLARDIYFSHFSSSFSVWVFNLVTLTFCIKKRELDTRLLNTI